MEDNPEDESQNKIFKPLTPLYNQNYEQLKWGLFSQLNRAVLRYYTVPDGSCLFHAILNSFFKVYRLSSLNGIHISQQEIVKQFRKDLANRLSYPSEEDPTKTNYEMLGGGTVKIMSETLPKYSLNSMKLELDSNEPIGDIYNEYISNLISKDIYLLCGTRRDVYMTGSPYNRLIKNRDSIVIIYLGGHYELVGTRSVNGSESTIFDYTDPFIKIIRNRMKKLCNNFED